MQLKIKGTVLSVYERPQSINKETGEPYPISHGLKMLVDEELKNGVTVPEMYDIKVDETTKAKYESHIGKEVTVLCSLYSRSTISLTAI